MFYCYLLLSSFKVFVNVFAFLYEKANSKEVVCEELSPFFSEKCWCQLFLLRFKANYLEKNTWLSPLVFVDYNCPCKGLLFFLHGPNLVQETFVFSRHRPYVSWVFSLKKSTAGALAVPFRVLSWKRSMSVHVLELISLRGEKNFMPRPQNRILLPPFKIPEQRSDSSNIGAAWDSFSELLSLGQSHKTNTDTPVFKPLVTLGLEISQI